MQTNKSVTSDQSKLAQISKQADLPNLNFGIHTRSLNCNIHPTIVSNILDHYLRRPERQNAVVGTLLGSIDGSKVDVQTCFAVPLEIEERKEKGTGKILVIDQDYSEKMLKFQRKVNPKESLIGFYYSGTAIDDNAIELFEYYQRLIRDPKNKGLLPQPLVLLIDPTMQNNQLTIKVLSLVMTPEVHRAKWVDEELEEERQRIEQVQVFAECPFKINLEEYEKTGMDIIFYGQQHYDTMAILQRRDVPDQDQIGELLEQQRLLPNKQLLARNFGEVISNLSECEKLIDDILAGKVEQDAALGRQLEECLGQFSTDDMNLLENQVMSNFDDALMISNLSKLQQHQIRVASSLNSVLSESIQLNSHFINTNKKQFAIKREIKEREAAAKK